MVLVCGDNDFLYTDTFFTVPFQKELEDVITAGKEAINSGVEALKPSREALRPTREVITHYKDSNIKVQRSPERKVNLEAVRAYEKAPVSQTKKFTFPERTVKVVPKPATPRASNGLITSSKANVSLADNYDAYTSVATSRRLARAQHNVRKATRAAISSAVMVSICGAAFVGVSLFADGYMRQVDLAPETVSRIEAAQMGIPVANKPLTVDEMNISDIEKTTFENPFTIANLRRHAEKEMTNYMTGLSSMIESGIDGFNM